MQQTIAVIGGSGNLGAALARRWAKAGRKVLIGSRTVDKAQEAAARLGAGLATPIGAAANLDAARAADVVVVTVPFASQAEVLETIRPALAGKIVIDTTVPLKPPRVARVQLPPEGSAAQRAQGLVGADVRLVSAFHNVAAHKLATDALVECDVLVFGDDKEARAVAVELAECAGLRGLHAGALANAVAAEALTSILIFLNKTYRVDGAGIRITGELDFSRIAD